MAEEEDIFHTPIMDTLQSCFVVKEPVGEAAPPQIPCLGGVSIGPSHLPKVGPVVAVAFHEPDGRSLVCYMGRNGLAEFATRMNAAMERIARGEFDQPESQQ